MKDEAIVVITCNDTRSQYYGEMMRTGKCEWDKNDEYNWFYWREATIFESDLYYMGVRKLPVIL